MKLQELTRFIQSGDVGSIVLLRYPDADAWEVWAYDHTDSRTLAPWGNRLVAGRTGDAKTYTSIDRAYSAIRKLGYAGPITIDG
jgi:hypothetical protein